MRILKADQIKIVDKFTIENEPIKSVDLMERASKQCFNWIIGNFPKENGHQFKIFCGLGNNGGDGLAITRMLIEEGYKTEIFLVKYSENQAEDNRVNEQRLVYKGIKINYISDKKELPLINKEDIVIDALIGAGLSKPIEGLLSDVIHRVNDSQSKVISIDLPTGLYCDSSSANNKFVINADYTLTFQFPKHAFLFPENSDYVGEWFILPIGLSPEGIDSQKTKNYLITEPDIKAFIKPRKKFSHKGTYGHALIIAGSHGSIGAAVLATRASLRIGAGLCTALIPECGYEIIQSAVPEAMVKTSGINFLEPELVKQLKYKYNAIAIGPGIGKEDDTAKALKGVIQNTDIPLILDADALNILSENKTWLSFLPEGCILTPHPKELERLIGKWKDDFDKQQMLIEFAVRYKLYVVLKGAYSITACPDGNCYFNSTGNPGMATAGSGDTLTGIIAGLYAQGYTAKESCILGTYIHGLAGDIAASEKSEQSLIASDIIDHLGKAFLHLT